MSASQRRVREDALNIRLFAHEREQLDALADEVDMNPAEMVRAFLFGYPMVARPRCSPAHPTCDPHHHGIVQGYRFERHHQEIAAEAEIADHHAGDKKLWKENGGRLITFAEWLRGYVRSD